MSKLLAFLGAILMAHAAISVGQFRGIMKERGDADAPIPFDIIIEVHIYHMINVDQLMSSASLAWFSQALGTSSD